jgi:indolepyruvate decarboxylase
MSTLGQVLLDALKMHGAREIFGVPGDFVLPFFKVIEESGTSPFYTLSHEPAVGIAAYAAARFRDNVESGIDLRLDVRSSPNRPEGVRRRLSRL